MILRRRRPACYTYINGADEWKRITGYIPWVSGIEIHVCQHVIYMTSAIRPRKLPKVEMFLIKVLHFPKKVKENHGQASVPYGTM